MLPPEPLSLSPSERFGWSGLLRGLGSRHYREAAFWGAIALLLAYGFAMTNFVLAGDDWFAIFPAETQDSHFALVAGRWLMPAVWAVTGNNAFVPYFSFALALLLLGLAGMVAAAVWGLRRRWAILAVVCLSAVNPLFTDTLAFKPIHLTYPLALLCANLAAWSLLRWQGRPWLRMLTAAGLLTLSLASYQPAALSFAVVIVGAEVLQALHGGSGKEALRRWAGIGLSVIAGLGLYLASVRLAWWITGTDPGSATTGYSMTGGYPSNPAEVGGALRYGFRMIGRFWFETTTLYPLALKVLTLLVIAGGLAVAVTAALRRPGSARARAGRISGLIFLALATGVIPFLVLFLREEPPLRGNVFTTVGLATAFWAALLVEGLTLAAPSRRRAVALPLAAALVVATFLGCAYEVNKGFFGLHLSNQRDLANANRMLSVMEQVPEFDQGAAIRVALIGQVAFPVAGAPFTDEVADAPGTSIVNCSGLACQNRLVRMLNLLGAGDREFIRRSPPSDPAAAALIEAMPSWPAAGSIRFINGVFVVKGG